MAETTISNPISVSIAITKGIDVVSVHPTEKPSPLVETNFLESTLESSSELSNKPSSLVDTSFLKSTLESSSELSNQPSTDGSTAQVEATSVVYIPSITNRTVIDEQNHTEIFNLYTNEEGWCA